MKIEYPHGSVKRSSSSFHIYSLLVKPRGFSWSQVWLKASTPMLAMQNSSYYESWLFISTSRWCDGSHSLGANHWLNERVSNSWPVDCKNGPAGNLTRLFPRRLKGDWPIYVTVSSRPIMPVEITC